MPEASPYVALSDYFNVGAVLRSARNDPLLKKKGYTREALSNTIIKHIRSAVIEAARVEMWGRLKPRLDEYWLHNGDVHVTEYRDEWEQGWDDVLEAECEPFVMGLSASWLGEKTIDSGAYDEDGLRKWCKSFGGEIYKQLTHGKTAADIFAECLITPDVIDDLFNSKAEKEPDMSNELADIVARVVAHVGQLDDTHTSLVTQAADDEPLIAEPALKMLGLTLEDHTALVTASLVHGNDLIAEFGNIAAGLAQSSSGDTGAPAIESGVAPPTKVEAPAAGRAKTAEPGAEGTVPQAVAEALKNLTALSDPQAATLCGCAKTTFLKIVKGTQSVQIDDATRARIRSTLIEHVNGLLGALGALEGREYGKME